jgi:IPT/TIG domain
MAQTGNAPLIAQDYLQVDPFKAPTKPANQNELLSQGVSTDPAFAYAVQQNLGLFPPAWEGDNATLDAIWAIAKTYKTPPTAPTLTSLSPNTAVNNTGPFLMTLTGTNFTPGSSVIFGTVTETRVTLVNATTLTVTIYPSYIPAAGTIQVSVKPGGGAAASANVAFTVT